MTPKIKDLFRLNCRLTAANTRDQAYDDQDNTCIPLHSREKAMLATFSE